MFSAFFVKNPSLKTQIESILLKWHLLYLYRDKYWNWVDDDAKRQLGLVDKDDGEFWMTYKDFVHHFTYLSICYTGPDFDDDGVVDRFGKRQCKLCPCNTNVSVKTFIIV